MVQNSAFGCFRIDIELQSCTIKRKITDDQDIFPFRGKVIDTASAKPRFINKASATPRFLDTASATPR